MLCRMRITLSLEKDVAAALERLRHSRKASLKEVVNDALRRGLAQMDFSRSPARKKFRTRPVSLGRCLVGNVDNISEILSVAEGESSK